MRASEVMTRDICVCQPEETLHDCARAMATNDVGALPVADNNMLVGMVTDRDIAIRAVAAGKGPDTRVGDVLSAQVLYCFEDQDLEHVAKSMGAAGIRRVPVLTRGNRVAGILSLGDVARRNPELAVDALAAVSKHGAPHST